MNALIVDQSDVFSHPVDLIGRIHLDSTFQTDFFRLMVDEHERWRQFFVGRREKVQRHFGCVLNRQLKRTGHVRRITITGNTLVSTSRMTRDIVKRYFIAITDDYRQKREKQKNHSMHWIRWNAKPCQGRVPQLSSLYSTLPHLEFVVVLFLLFARHIKIVRKKQRDLNCSIRHCYSNRLILVSIAGQRQWWSKSSPGKLLSKGSLIEWCHTSKEQKERARGHSPFN